MKKQLGILVALLAGSASTFAADGYGESPRERAVMLYVSKSFGSTQRQNRTPLAFGLRLQQSAPFDRKTTLPLLDLRYTLDGRKSLLAAGAVAFGSLDGSSTEESFSKTWFWVIAGTAALGTLCATGNLICKDGGRRDTQESPGLD